MIVSAALSSDLIADKISSSAQEAASPAWDAEHQMPNGFRSLRMPAGLRRVALVLIRLALSV
jgi:hypothetical protein